VREFRNSPARDLSWWEDAGPELAALREKELRWLAAVESIIRNSGGTIPLSRYRPRRRE